MYCRVYVQNGVQLIIVSSESPSCVKVKPLPHHTHTLTHTQNTLVHHTPLDIF